MFERNDDGSYRIDHLETAAARGSNTAQEVLDNVPDYPQALEYLLDWSRDLYGRSGASMSGLLPLSFETLDAWSRLMGITLDPLEVEALILLNTVMLYPGDPEEDAEMVEATRPAWPTKKDT